jgi:hypothetical protein
MNAAAALNAKNEAFDAYYAAIEAGGGWNKFHNEQPELAAKMQAANDAATAAHRAAVGSQGNPFGALNYHGSNYMVGDKAPRKN